MTGYLDVETSVNKHKRGHWAGRRRCQRDTTESTLHTPPVLFSFLFNHSLSHFFFFFFPLLTVITPALPSVARGVAGQNHSLIWICRVCEEEDYSLAVSVETLGCKQPAPVCPYWDKEVRKPHLGDLCVCVKWDHPFSKWTCNNYKSVARKQALVTNSLRAWYCLTSKITFVRESQKWRCDHQNRSLRNTPWSQWK